MNAWKNAEQVNAEWMRDLGRSPETALEIEQAAIIRELKAQPADGVVVPRPTEIKTVGKHSLQFIYLGDTTRDDVLALLAAAKEQK